jgi:deazaflavin-dependent oxidoreductase (nitroreductase family)
MDYLNWVEKNWGILGRAMQGHTMIYRVSGGRIGHRIPGVPPMLLLDHTGAKSGAQRTSPLVYGVDRADLILVASKGGYPKNPGWFYNLKANPDTEVQIGSEHRSVHAHVADAAERKRLWPLMLKVYGGYAEYQKRTEREIPLVILSPR